MTTLSLLLPAAALAAAGGAATIAVAADSPAPPVAAFTLGDGSTAPSGPATVAPGAVRITVGTKARGRHAFQVLRLSDGADVAAVQKRLGKVRTDDDFEAITEMSGVGGTAVSAARKGSIVADLKAGTYLLADISSQKAVPSTPFTVGPGTGKALPPATATISLFDYKFEVAGKLPRSGDVRLVNKGRRNHILVVFKAADAKGAARLLKAVKADDQRAAGKEIRGEGTGANVIGPGVTHDLRVAQAPGTYVLACFLRSRQSGGKAHNKLGMAKVVTVR